MSRNKFSDRNNILSPYEQDALKLLKEAYDLYFYSSERPKITVNKSHVVEYFNALQSLATKSGLVVHPPYQNARKTQGNEMEILTTLGNDIGFIAIEKNIAKEIVDNFIKQLVR